MTYFPDTTPRLGLPMIAPGQALKHITHNEALMKLDARIHISVSAEVNDLPSEADDGDRVLLMDGRLAAFSAGVWEMIDPAVGWLVWREDLSQLAVYTGAGWSDVNDTSEADGAYARLGVGGAVTNSMTPLAVAGAASLFDHDGSDHRVLLNKAGVGDFATLVFQNNYSGRAEIGLAGEDAFSFKVSSDGVNFTEAIRIDPTTGRAHFLVPNLPDGTDSFTIAGNEVILTTTRQVELYYVKIATGLQIDELHTILGGQTGQILVLQIPGSAIDVVLKDQVGNLNLAGDLTLTRPTDIITLICRNGDWHELSRSDN